MPTATVSYRAEIKDLRAKLASIPDITRAEARKMVSELDKAFKQTERGAVRANKSLASLVNKTQQSMMSQSQRAASMMDAELAQLNRLKAAGADAAKVEQARVAIIEAGAKRIAAARAREVAATKATAASLDTVARNMKGLAGSARNVAVQLPDVFTQLAAGTPVAQVLAQQGLQVVQVEMLNTSGVAAQLGVTMSGMAAAFLTVGLPAVAALGAAYVIFSRQLEEAEAKAAAMAKTSGAVSKAHNELEAAVEAVALEHGKVTGTLDSITAAQEKRDKAVKKAAEAERRAAAAVLAHAKAQKEQAEGQEEVAAATKALARARQQHTRLLAGANTREREALKQSAEIAEYQRERAESEETLRRREEERTRATQAAAKADAEALRLIRERSAASDRLAAISARSSLVVLEGEARVNEEYRRRLAQIAELERVSGDHINADVARATSRLEFEKRLADLRERNAAKTAAHENRLAQQTERARQQAMQESMDLAGQLASTVSAGASATYDRQVENLARLQDYQARSSEYLTEHQKKQLDERVKDQRRAAANAFNASQAAAAAEAAVQTALAVSKALAAAPPPFNFVLAGTALAGGLAQQAAIQRAQPAFHQGGEVLAPDEQQAVVRAREFVLNPTGREMMGDDALERANAGQSPRGGGEVVAVSVYKHTRQVDRWKRDGLNAGDPIARAIDRGRLVGLRSNR